MPMFPNKQKQAEKQIAHGIEQLVIAFILESGYDAMCGLDAEANGRYVVQWDREDYLSYITQEDSEVEDEAEEDSEAWHAEYEAWRDDHYQGMDDYLDHTIWS